MNLDQITELADSSVFKMEDMPFRPADHIEHQIFGFMFEMSLDLLVVARNGYNVLDLLSDVGGIESIIISGIGIFLSVFNYKHFDSYMVSQLYQSADNKPFTPTKVSNIKLFCIDLLPSKLACCKLNAQ